VDQELLSGLPSTLNVQAPGVPVTAYAIVKLLGTGPFTKLTALPRGPVPVGVAHVYENGPACDLIWTAPSKTSKNRNNAFVIVFNL
jgi:hypothetical protein